MHLPDQRCSQHVIEARRDAMRPLACPAKALMRSHIVPAAQSDRRPDGLDESERPSPLEKPVERSKSARDRECKYEPRAALLKSVADEHRGDREQAESRKTIHHPDISRLKKISGNETDTRAGALMGRLAPHGSLPWTLPIPETPAPPAGVSLFLGGKPR
jgi:hypothetical protein